MRQPEDSVPDLIFADRWNGFCFVFLDASLVILDHCVDLEDVHDTGADGSNEEHVQDSFKDP